MYLFQLKKIAFSFCLVFAVFTANAAGLGNLNLMSGLGEPLNAEVELLSVKADELTAIQAMIASEQAYADQSLEKPSSHNSIKVEVTKNTRGEPILKLVSSQPMSDAFLDMLIQVEWPTGRLVKEYTVLLDPPGYEQKLAASPTVNLPSPAPLQEKATEETSATLANNENAAKSEGGASEDSVKADQAESKQTVAKLSPEQLALEKAKIKYKFKDAGSKEKAQTQANLTTVSGDTLYAIARANQVEGVSLEQMLIGLYQANPNAFINKNINRLKVGQVLNVPDQGALENINPSQAKREYKAQSAHWNTYKNKLAGLVKQSKASAEESHAQQSAGKVVAAEDKSLPVNTGVKDVVKLSAGDAKSKSSSDKSFQDKVNALQEEITAKDNAVKEAKSRTTDLEKQVSEMQKLLALKNDAMLKLQQNADVASKQMKPAETTVLAKNQDLTKTDVKPEREAESNASSANNNEQAAKQGAEKQALESSSQAATKQTEPPKIPLPNKIEAPQVTPQEPVVEKPSFIASLLNRLTGFASGMKLNPTSLLGLLGIPVLGGVWWVFRQKRKKNLTSFEDGIMSPSVSDMTVNTVFGNTKGGTVEAGDTSFLTDFSQSAVGGMIDANDVDPIAEAEVYMAYGRDAQAEEILKDAIAKEPKRYELHLKLLEIYQSTKNSSAFEAIAGELYANLGGNHQSWLKIAEMGVKLDPNNPLYQSTGSVLEKSTANEKVSEASVGESQAPNSSKSPMQSASSTANFAEFDLNFETPSPDFAIEESSPSFKNDATKDSTTLPDQIAFSNTINIFDEQVSVESIKPDVVVKTSIVPADYDADTNNLRDNDDLSLDTSQFANTLTPKSLDLPTIDFVATPKSASSSLKGQIDIAVNNVTDDAVEMVTSTESVLNPSEIFKSVPSLNFDVEGLSDLNRQASKLNQENAFESVEEEITLTSTINASDNETAISNVTLSPEAIEEIETKLDLIKAYIDMEDTVGAKELIEEVLKEGTEDHRNRANELLAQVT